ncbi:MAG: IPTL-CTERM sorting domain-containing protein [Xanthomonadales bacterium]|nr:IPTL-CTERM sorting domain-containing protein [Xanthomonadales bacterium]
MQSANRSRPCADVQSPVPGSAPVQQLESTSILRNVAAVALLSLLSAQAAFADPDLPGATQNLVSIPSGSLIIPMDNALQAQGLAPAVGFNLKAYGLANKMLQNNVPMSWAIRYNKPKIRGIVSATQATCSPLTSATSSFVAGGVQVGDLVTNVTDGMTRGRVTTVTATTLTLAAIGGDPLDCAIGDEFVADGADFTVNAARIRPTPIAAADIFFAGGPFIISNAVPQHVTKAIIVASTKFIANALESSVTMYQTTADAEIDIRYALQHKPFAAISDWNTFIHSAVMDAAGIPGAACTSDCGKKQAVYVNCITPGTPGFDPDTCNWNVINPLLLSTVECATAHLEPHRDGQLAPATISQVLAAVNAFVVGGGNLLAECHATQYFENANLVVPPNTVGTFVTQFGVAGNGTKGIQSYPNAPMAYSQITGPLDGEQGGSITSWTLNGGVFINNGYVNTQLITDLAIQKSAASKVKPVDTVGGNIMYLGGHAFKNNTLQQINGRRMTLNALFIPPDRPFQCGLSINGALVIVKRVVNDNGGAAVVGDFGITTDAGTLNFQAPVSDGTDTLSYTADTLTVLAGQPYSLVETPLAGYSEGTWSCLSNQPGSVPEDNGPAGNGTVDLLDPGVTKTCTITNDDLPTSLIIRKRVVNDNGGTATASSFGVSSSAGAVSFGVGAADGANTLLYTATTLSVAANTAYTLVENNFAGYSEGTWSCTGGDDAGGGAFGGGSVTVATGITKTCTITNNDDTASLTIVKQITNDNGGTAVVADFSITTSADALSFGAPSGTTTKTYTATALTVNANTPYTLVETDVAGYSEGSWSCVGGDNAGGGAFGGGSVTLASGGSKTCTIINNDVAPQLTLRKLVVNDGGSTNEADEWMLSATGTGGFSGTPTGTATDASLGPTAVTAGVAYALGESGPSGYLATSFTCDGGNLVDQNITLAVGDDVTCQFTNDDSLADLDLAKTVKTEAALQPDGTYKVVYTITATNIGQGQGFYDLNDLFSPGDGITVSGVPTAAYDVGVGENNQSGTLGAYTTFVTNEGLAADQFESWTVTAFFTVDPAGINATSQCNGDLARGFYNYVDGVEGGESVLTDNDACSNLPDPAINLAKTLKTAPVLQGNGTYTVVYTITASNSGQGPGYYDLDDAFSPGAGIVLNGVPTAVYVAGTESTQSGTLGAYPAFVTGEALAAQKNEEWDVTANFTVVPASVSPNSSQCDPADPVINTGFYNYVDGSSTDTDLSDNDTCAGLPGPNINLAKTVKTEAALQQNGTYTVVYTITASNSGQGPGFYDLNDTLSPGGTGITVNGTPTAVYVAGTESTQSGTLGAYPAFVTGEALAAQNNEKWDVTANFNVDPPLIDGTSQCDGDPDDGFYNYVDGVADEEDLEDNDACSDLPLPNINLAKTVNGPAVKEANGSYTVVYTITATNNGNGPGYYDLDDAFSPGAGITLNSAPSVYVAGTENSQTGTLGFVPKLVDDEALAGLKNEAWTVTVNSAIDPAEVDPASNECNGENTGFYNYVSGVVDEEDLMDNDACTGLELPQINTAFRVLKHFTDGNPMDVEVKINCFTGLPLTQTQEINENRDVVFIVQSFEPGTLDCDIDEVVPEGYSPSYGASSDGTSGTPGVAGEITDDSAGCHFEDVESGDFICSIVNTPEPVVLVVEKTWIVEGTGGDQVNQNFELELVCDTYIVGAETSKDCYDPRIEPDLAAIGEALAEEPKPPIECSLEFHGTGDNIYGTEVVPEYLYSHCSVDEHIYDDAVEVDNGCKNLVVSAGQGDSCLITNTVFFEGIPTLNQYGMMLLALLMLGVGMVGFRRFV